MNSDEVNYLVYRYLQESGFTHSAFTFAHESLVSRSIVADSEVPPGALLSFLQKGLQYIEVESHLQEDGTERQCDEPFHLLTPHVCRVKAIQGKSSSSSLSDQSSSSSSSLMYPEPLPSGTEISPNDVTVLSGHSAEVYGVAWNPINSTVLATGAGDATARLWRLPESSISARSTQDVASLILRHTDTTVSSNNSSNKSSKKEKGDVANLEWNSTGTQLVTGFSDGKLRLWNTEEGTLINTLQQHTGGISSIHYNPSGQYILSTSYDKTAVLWDSMTGEARQSFGFHTAPILDCQWYNDNTFVTCGTDKLIHVCSIGERVPTRTFAGHTDEINTMDWNPSHTLLASGSDDGTVRIWNMNNPNNQEACTSVLQGGLGHSKRQNIYCVEWSPTGEGSKNPSKTLQLACASFDGTVKLWDATTLTSSSSSSNNSTKNSPSPLYTLSRHTALVYALGYSPDGEYLVTGSADRSIYVWSTRDGSVARSYMGPSAVFDIAFSPDSSKVAAAYANGTSTVFDLRR